jgi:aspartate kinase
MDSVWQQQPTPQSYDLLLSFGERLSVRIFSAYLRTRGIKAIHFDGWDIGIVSSSEHTRAQILPKTYEQIPRALQRMGLTVPVITGFIAKSEEGVVTTLGRGGSDLTASVVAKALMVREVQLWKDVGGILTADPRLVSDARPISHLSFLEASMLARYGAKVLHPDSVLPAMSAQIPVRVKNYQDPSQPGTLIQSLPSQCSQSVVAIAHSPQEGGKSCVALIGPCDSSEVVKVLFEEGICPLEMCIPKLIVNDSDLKRCVEVLHRRFCVGGVQ